MFLCQNIQTCGPLLILPRFEMLVSTDAAMAFEKPLRGVDFRRLLALARYLWNLRWLCKSVNSWPVQHSLPKAFNGLCFMLFLYVYTLYSYTGHFWVNILCWHQHILCVYFIFCLSYVLMNWLMFGIFVFHIIFIRIYIHYTLISLYSYICY